MSYESQLKAHYSELRKKFQRLPPPPKKPVCSPIRRVETAPPIAPSIVPQPAAEPNTPLPARRILLVVQERRNVSIEAMKASGRQPYVVEARHLAMYFMRLFLKLSLTKIGYIFNRDHTSVLHAIRMIAEYRACCSIYDQELMQLENQLGGEATMFRTKESLRAPPDWHKRKI